MWGGGERKKKAKRQHVSLSQLSVVKATVANVLRLSFLSQRVVSQISESDYQKFWSVMDTQMRDVKNEPFPPVVGENPANTVVQGNVKLLHLSSRILNNICCIG